MSVDFDFLKWRNARKKRFPINYDRAPDETAPLPWEEIKSYLVGLGARENGGPDSLWLDLGEEGHLQIRGSRDKEDPAHFVWIGINCRAYWTRVLEIYRHARSIEPDLVLFDPQEGVFHDPESFEPLAIAQRKFQDGEE